MKGEWIKWLDWVVVANAAYQAIVALLVIVGTTLSVPLLGSLALNINPFGQAIGILGNMPLLTGIVALMIYGIIAMFFYKHIGKKLDGKEDFSMFIVKFVVFTTLLASIATLNFLMIALSGYMFARLWKYLG
jgi:hypothetical protein